MACGIDVALHGQTLSGRLHEDGESVPIDRLDARCHNGRCVHPQPAAAHDVRALGGQVLGNHRAGPWLQQVVIEPDPKVGVAIGVGEKGVLIQAHARGDPCGGGKGRRHTPRVRVSMEARGGIDRVGGRVGRQSERDPLPVVGSDRVHRVGYGSPHPHPEASRPDVGDGSTGLSSRGLQFVDAGLRACQTITDFCVLGAAGWIV